jgi:hypothetical protein
LKIILKNGGKDSDPKGLRREKKAHFMMESHPVIAGFE